MLHYLSISIEPLPFLNDEHYVTNGTYPEKLATIKYDHIDNRIR